MGSGRGEEEVRQQGKKEEGSEGATEKMEGGKDREEVKLEVTTTKGGGSATCSLKLRKP